MPLEAIFATDEQGGMGLNGRMPWPRLKEDMWNFKYLTQHNAIVMGSKTWLSKDMKNPLPHRTSAVWTRQTPEQLPLPEDVFRLNGDPIACLKVLQSLLKYQKVFVIGGAETLRAWIPICDTVYHTEIHESYDCDTVYKNQEWQSEFYRVSEPHLYDVNGLEFAVSTWRRIQ